MKLWMKLVVMLNIIIGLLLLSAGVQEERLAWGQELHEEKYLLMIFHGGEEGSEGSMVPEDKEVDPGAITVGSPTGSEDPDAQYEFPLMQLAIGQPPPCETSVPEPVTLKVVSGNIALLDPLNKQEIPGSNGEYTLPLSPLFPVPFVWIQAKEPSESIGDIVITATSECYFDTVKATAVLIDMDIHHGNNKKDSSGKLVSTVVTDDEEETRGAFTVVNRNDTDADGDPDYKDFNGVLDEVDLMKLIIRITPKPLLNHPSFEDFVTVEIVEGNDHVALWKDSTKVTKQPPVSPGSGVYKFPFADFDPHLGSKTVWIEATKPSNASGDVKIQLAYKAENTEGTDIVKATGIWPEVDVREPEVDRPYNRVGRNDPRMTSDDVHARNKLLVWHDSNTDNAITFEVVKTDVPDGGNTLDNKSPIWIQIEEKTPMDPLLGPPPRPLNDDILPFCERLEKDSQQYPDRNHPKLHFPLAVYSNPQLSDTILLALVAGEEITDLPDLFIRSREDYFVSDFVVSYGIDYDDSQSLSGEEIKGKYEIFGITTDDFIEARRRYDAIYLKTVWQLGQALCYKFSYGEWEQPSILPGSKDYRPDKDGSCAPGRKNEGKSNDSCTPGYEEELSMGELTHNVGASFSNHTTVLKDVEDYAGGPKYPRQYYDAKSIKIPIYENFTSSDASELFRTSEYFREAVADSLFNKYKVSFTAINNGYKNATGIGPTKAVSVPFPKYSIDFKAFQAIGIGWGTINPEPSDSLTIPFTPGTITLDVTPINPDTYEISRYLNVKSTVFDRWDYNYFKPGRAHTTLASVSGSSIQTGFNKVIFDTSKKPGQTASEIYLIDGNVDLFSGPELLEMLTDEMDLTLIEKIVINQNGCFLLDRYGMLRSIDYLY